MRRERGKKAARCKVDKLGEQVDGRGGAEQAAQVGVAATRRPDRLSRGELPQVCDDKLG